mmetsp:Transcript_95380/g.291685  ORF Transcript_95380/g.291685 Transcript_95380/m.291685 type:complete len:337 (-) Transcript_95380:888-1898(-)
MLRGAQRVAPGGDQRPPGRREARRLAARPAAVGGRGPGDVSDDVQAPLGGNVPNVVIRSELEVLQQAGASCRELNGRTETVDHHATEVLLARLQYASWHQRPQLVPRCGARIVDALLQGYRKALFAGVSHPIACVPDAQAAELVDHVAALLHGPPFRKGCLRLIAGVEDQLVVHHVPGPDAEAHVVGRVAQPTVPELPDRALPLRARPQMKLHGHAFKARRLGLQAFGADGALDPLPLDEPPLIGADLADVQVQLGAVAKLGPRGLPVGPGPKDLDAPVDVVEVAAHVADEAPLHHLPDAGARHVPDLARRQGDHAAAHLAGRALDAHAKAALQTP